jgi:hypothetical protein
MSEYHPDVISTLQEWNARLCDCCPMPLCLEPIVEVKSICAVMAIFTFNSEESECEGLYNKQEITRTVIGTQTDGVATLAADFFLSIAHTWPIDYYRCGTAPLPDSDHFCGGTYSFTNATVTENGTLTDMAGMPDPRWTGAPPAPILSGPSFPMWTIVITDTSGTYTIYRAESYGTTQGTINGRTIPSDWVINPPNLGYSEPVDCSTLYSRFLAIPKEDFLQSILRVEYLCNECGGTPGGRMARYRMIVPPCHAGSYYKIQWDEVFFPDAYLQWLNDARNSIGGIESFDPNANPPPEMPVVTAREWEWIGEALGDCPTVGTAAEISARLLIESRKSEWIELESELQLEEENIYNFGGEYRIMNMLVTCYRSQLGIRPQGINDLDVFSLDDLDQDGTLDSEEPI